MDLPAVNIAVNESCVKRQRADAAAHISAKRDAGGRTRLDDLYQRANAKIRLPRKSGASALEAVLINTSGGMTGGDRLEWRMTAGPDAAICATTQACEKIYRSEGDIARVETHIDVAEGARVDWLPQETILFDRAALERKLEVDLGEGASFLAMEAIVLGRKAMGETVSEACLQDRWRIRRNNRLLHADSLTMTGNLAGMAHSPAVLNGKQAFATLIFVPAIDDRETLQSLCQRLQVALETVPVAIGISALPGRLAMRVAADDMFELRKALVPAVGILSGDNAVPKVWSI